MPGNRQEDVVEGRPADAHIIDMDAGGVEIAQRGGQRPGATLDRKRDRAPLLFQRRISQSAWSEQRDRLVEPCGIGHGHLQALAPYL